MEHKAQQQTKARREAEANLRATLLYVAVCMAAIWNVHEDRWINPWNCSNFDSTGIAFHSQPGAGSVIFAKSTIFANEDPVLSE